MKRMIIYGAGGLGHFAYLKMKDKFNILAYVDSEKDKQSLKLNGLKVYPPEMLEQLEYDVIEVCTGTSSEIIKQSLIQKYQVAEKLISTEFVGQSDAARENTLILASVLAQKECIKGNVAELGVYRGKFAKELNRYFPDRTLYLFDTFEGLPTQDLEFDAQKGYSKHKASYLQNTTVDEVLGVMPYPEKCVIMKGYFPESIQGLEDTFAFVSLDPDLYRPILDGMRYFYPRLQEGGIIMIHDYSSPFFTGVMEAVKDYEEEIGKVLPKTPVGDLMSIAITKIEGVIRT